jgi:hypothetical protein
MEFKVTVPYAVEAGTLVPEATVIAGEAASVTVIGVTPAVVNVYEVAVTTAPELVPVWKPAAHVPE